MTSRRALVVLALATSGCALVLGLGDEPTEGTAALLDGGGDASTSPVALTFSPPSIERLTPGGTARVTVIVARPAGLEGPVTLSVTEASGAVSAPPITVAAGSDQGELVVTAAPAAKLGPLDAKIGAALGGLAGDARYAITIVPHGGLLDPTFADGGVALVAVAGDGGNEQLNAVTLEGSGAIYAAGATTPGGAALPDVAILRLDAKGALDPSFGDAGDGRVVVPAGGAQFLRAIVLQDPTHLLTAGESTITLPQAQIFRLETNGVIGNNDLSRFAGTAALGLGASAYAVAVSASQSVTRRLVGGALDGTAKVWSLDAQNLPDTTFVGTASLSGDGGLAGAVVALRADELGVAALVDTIEGGGTTEAIALIRILASNGKPDPNFAAGSGGIFYRAAPGTRLRAMASQAQGYTVAGYRISGGSRKPLVCKILRNGLDFDRTFGTDGCVMLAAVDGDCTVNDLAIDAKGRMLVAGGRVVGAAKVPHGFLVRLDPAGTIDSSFGTNGVVELLVVRAGPFAGIALQPDGRIVIVGTVPGEVSVPDRGFVGRVLP